MPIRCVTTARLRIRPTRIAIKSAVLEIRPGKGSLGSIASQSAAHRRCRAAAVADPSAGSGSTPAGKTEAASRAASSNRAHPGSTRERVRQRFCSERGDAGQGFVQAASIRPDVRPFVDRVTSRLLWAHVCGGAEDDPQLRERRTGHCWRQRHAGRRHIADHGFRQPEVEHLHRAVIPYLDVRRLQIAMDDSLFVRGLERLGDLLRNRQRLVDRDRTLSDAVGKSGPSTSSITRAVMPALLSRP